VGKIIKIIYQALIHKNKEKQKAKSCKKYTTISKLVSETWNSGEYL
jgi:hypothetical protein